MRTILCMPSSIQVDDDLINFMWYLTQNFGEESNSSISDSDYKRYLYDLLIFYQSFQCRWHITNWATPSRTLIHHQEPGVRIKAFQVFT
jgi:hypothetical protein